MCDIRQYMTVSRFSAPVWVGEKEIACLHSCGGVAQIWKKNLETGKTRKVTQNTEAIRSLQGYPAIGSLLFTIDVGGSENEQIYLMDAQDEIHSLTGELSVAHRLGGFRPGTDRVVFTANMPDPDIFDVYERSVTTGEQTLLHHDDSCIKIPSAISPDGRYVLYNVLLGEYNNALYMIDVYTGVTTKVPDDAVISAETWAVWKPDSTGFYVITGRESDMNYVAIYDIATGLLEPFYRSAWSVTHMSLSPDGTYLAVVTNDDGYAGLKVIDTETKEIYEPEGLPECVIGSVNTVYEPIPWSPTGHKLLFQLSNSETPGCIWLVDLDKKEASCILAETPEKLPKDMVMPQLRRFTSFDGVEVPYWLFVPKGADNCNLPVMLDIHGGPENQTRPEYIDYMQYYLSQGIAIVAPNVRGSTGYGRRYTDLDNREKRLDSVRDIGALIDHLITTGIADSSRVAVLGISYGGFMTLSSISMFPNVWACAVDFVGIYNFVTFLENTSGYRRAWRESEYGTLAQDREMLLEVSPVTRIHNAVAPLLVIHGANDPRVPISETEEMTRNLRIKGNIVEYIRYEDEGHNVLKLKNRIDCYGKACEFLKKHLNLE